MCPPFDPARRDEEPDEIDDPRDISLCDGSDAAADRLPPGCRLVANEREIPGDLGQLLVGKLPRPESGHGPRARPDGLTDLGGRRVEDRGRDGSAADRVTRPCRAVARGAG